MLTEASRVLTEGIVREPGDVDMGLILGIGFPAFRGGILRWADYAGAAEGAGEAEEVRTVGKTLPTDGADEAVGERGQGLHCLVTPPTPHFLFFSPPQARPLRTFSPLLCASVL